MPIKKKRKPAAKDENVGHAKRLFRRIVRMVADRKAVVSARKMKARRLMKTAVDQAMKAGTPQEFAAIQANPKLARKVNEEAAVRAAAKYGINIRKENGTIDMKLARKAAEAAAIQSAAEMGFKITNKRGKISRSKALEAARAADAARAGSPVNAQVKAAVDRQDAQLAAAAREAGLGGFSADHLRIEELKSNPHLAQKAAEEVVIQEAAATGVNIRKKDGTLDPRLARKVAEGMAIRSAAEMGIDISNGGGKINRRKALQAARAADAARAGSPVNAQVKAAITRQDARLMAALNAVERKDASPAIPSGGTTRQDAYTDTELAALIRRSILEKVR